MKIQSPWLFEAPFISSERQQWPVYLNFEDELEGSVSSVLYEGQGTLSQGQEALIIRQAIQAGIRDENELTNRVFSARYPKRRGRTLTKSDPDYRQLSQEWLSIRNNLVRTALQSLPSRQPTFTPTATPTLLDTKSQPEGTTLYVKIPLGGEKPAQPMTGIFIPSGYRINSQVDLIIYLHGHHRDSLNCKKPAPGKKPAPDCCKKPGPGCTPDTFSINQHWNAAFYPYFAFREGVKASGKNVILVAPTLGPRSQEGNLVKGGLDAYLDQVMASLSAYGPYQGRQFPRVGNIILACHSGGGRPMRQIALSKHKYTANIREYWGFDCTYNTGDDTEWFQWAKKSPLSSLYIYFLDFSSTQFRAYRLKNLSKMLKNKNVSVVKADEAVAKFKGTQPGLTHNWVPITYWEERIKASPSLS